MIDPRLEKMARVLVRYSVRAGPGDFLTISSTTAAEPLVKAVYREALRAGAVPSVLMSFPEAEEIYYAEAQGEQLDLISPIRWATVEDVDCHIRIEGDLNTRALSNVDPAKQARRRKADQPLLERYMERAAKGEYRWCVTLYPTPGYAQDAEMSLTELESFVYGACLLDQDDPVQAWEEVSRRQQGLVDFLSRADEIHLVGPDTDLRFSVKGRTWINADGTYNFPDGEVFTGPVEESFEGRIAFSYPAVIYGREVEGVELEFRGGSVVQARAQKNEAFLHSMLDTDEGARRVGEFSFGANPGIQTFIKNTLFDEKIGGTIHLALGASYPQTGGVNKSAVHWDMVCDLRNGGRVLVDGELFAENGQFLVGAAAGG